jgi:hypothetical protein
MNAEAAALTRRSLRMAHRAAHDGSQKASGQGRVRFMRRLPPHRHGSPPIHGTFKCRPEPSARPLILAAAVQPSLPRKVNVPLMSLPDTAAANAPDISVDVNSPVSEAADWVMDTETGCSIPLLDVTPRSVTLTIPDHRPPTAAGRRSGETPLELPQPAVTTSSDNSARARGVIRTIANQFTPCRSVACARGADSRVRGARQTERHYQRSIRINGREARHRPPAGSPRSALR